MSTIKDRRAEFLIDARAEVASRLDDTLALIRLGETKRAGRRLIEDGLLLAYGPQAAQDPNALREHFTPNLGDIVDHSRTVPF